MKTARGHLMPLQQHLYNGLTRPADYSIFAWEWTRSPEFMLVRKKLEWCGYPTVKNGSVAVSTEYRHVIDRQTDGRTDRQTSFDSIVRTMHGSYCVDKTAYSLSK